MNLSLIRLIDSRFGQVVCNYLYSYDKFRSKFPPLHWQEGEIKRILVIKFWGIGNLVQASPTMRSIRQIFPDAEIVFLTLAQNKGVYERSNLYDKVIYLRLTTAWDFTRELIRLFFRLRNFNFNLIINLEPLVYFGELISFYVGVGDRVGFSVPGRTTLYTKPIEFREDEHIARTFYRVLSAFGVEAEPSEEQLLPERIPLSKDDLQVAEELLRAEGVTQDDYLIGVNVNASDVAKERRWPLENFATLCDMAIERLNAKILLVGAPDEVPYVERAVAMMRREPINLAGRTNLREAIALISKMNLFITNDSGPLHLAYAMRVPTISFFGPESPRRYGPLGEAHTAFFKGLDCSPCIYFKNLKKANCKQNARCLRMIKTGEVYESVEKNYHQWLADRAAKTMSI
ncbi:MAG: glycosyltransferase family 9 protein [bacterium]|nr:glycosyltransferase family 9 protein [bacterium]